MKFCIIILSICLVQICSSSEQPNRSILEIPDVQYFVNGSHAIKDISQQFIDDISIIREKFPHNSAVTVSIVGLLDMLANSFHGKDARIEVSALKEFPTTVDDEYWIIDGAQILHSILSKELPAERTNGIMNLWLSLRAASSKTDEEIQNALGYLYGTEAHPMDIITNIPPISILNCSMEQERRPNEINGIRSKADADINPKVFEDLTVIAEKFPCERYISGFLNMMEMALTAFANKKSTIDVCAIKNHDVKSTWTGDAVLLMNLVKPLLVLRVPQEHYTELVNLAFVMHLDTTTKDIENALKYVYGSDKYKPGKHLEC